MNPWIQNVSMSDVKLGRHISCGENSMLIQIVDPAHEFPNPLYKFREVHKFEFLDIEDPNCPKFGEFAVTEGQAQKLVDLLQHALDNRMNVLVHCHAGVCRSGAVCEVGVMMGFRDTGSHRIPNLLVKGLMLQKLGWSYK